MIVDTSAIMAILRGEPEAAAFTSMILGAKTPIMSAAISVELSAVITRGHPHLKGAADRLLDAGCIALSPLTNAQARIASAAYAHYGRGTGHPADLNFGDCFSYALAKETGEPLLFKGDDFTHTDVLAAVPPS